MWPNRVRVPESCRDLDHDRVIAALVATNVNITLAAKKLHVPSVDLRRLLFVSPELLALAAEKEERRLDRAEEILDRELDSSDPRYSAAAAFFVLRNARRAAERGWRQPDVEVNVHSAEPARIVSVRWADGEEIGRMAVPAGTPIPRPSLIEHDDSERPTDAEAASSSES
jgi:hypothetical protein